MFGAVNGGWLTMATLKTYSVSTSLSMVIGRGVHIPPIQGAEGKVDV